MSVKKKVIIFGLKDLAQLAHFYFKSDSEYEPVAFTVNEEFISQQEYQGLPVIPFETIEKKMSPREFEMFIPMTQTKMGYLRRDKYLEGKAKGYNFATYISSKSAYFGTPVGENSFIFEDNTIQPFTQIGNNVILWSGNHIGHHSKIGDHVFLTSHVVISGHCVIEPYCFFGVNSTVRDFTHVREGTLVGMGASITKDTEAYGVYLGNKQTKKDQVKSLDIM